ncbi:MAG: hypothetical protein ACR2N3_16200 [Pyrinomonadaceae bacterium]
MFEKILKTPKGKLNFLMLTFFVYVTVPIFEWFSLENDLVSGRFSINADSIGLDLFTKVFWKRQFQIEATNKQKVFDWTFGVILPVACIFFDFAVFKGAFSHHGALLGEYKPFVYMLSFAAVILLMLFLFFGSKLNWLNGIFAGLFAIGAAVSLLIGIVLFPLSLIGLIILIGAIGFTPLLTAFVFARNAIRSLKIAWLTSNKILLVNSFAVSAIFSFVFPYVFYANVENSLRKMENGSPAEIRRERDKFKYFSPFVNFDRLGLKSCGDPDERKVELLEAVYQLTGKNTKEVYRLYCYDW